MKCEDVTATVEIALEATGLDKAGAEDAKRLCDCMIFGFGKSTMGMVAVGLIAFC